MSELPIRRKTWRPGTEQVGIFVRFADGSTIELVAKRSTPELTAAARNLIATRGREFVQRVFNRLTDDELWSATQTLCPEDFEEPEAIIDAIRRCIAAATQLPQGAVSWTGDVTVSEIDGARAVSVANGVAEMDLPAGSKGQLQIIYIPEKTS